MNPPPIMSPARLQQMADRYVLATTNAAHIDEHLLDLATFTTLLASISDANPGSVPDLCRVGLGWLELQEQSLKAHQDAARQVRAYVEQDERTATA